jgi:hypothetical protein
MPISSWPSSFCSPCCLKSAPLEPSTPCSADTSSSDALPLATCCSSRGTAPGLANSLLHVWCPARKLQSACSACACSGDGSSVAVSIRKSNKRRLPKANSASLASGSSAHWASQRADVARAFATASDAKDGLSDGCCLLLLLVLGQRADAARESCCCRKPRALVGSWGWSCKQPKGRGHLAVSCTCRRLNSLCWPMPTEVCSR